MADLLEELRPRAFAIAYRMLGSVSEAEDVVQEGLLRLHSAMAAGEEIASPPAYLATVVTRLAIDERRSARARRETYVGEWLPEPVLTEDRDSPAARTELADSLSLAFLVMLESLSPEQRAVFLLREAFDYPFPEDVALHGDGGGKVPSLGRALHGRGRVAKGLRNWNRRMSRSGRVTVRPAQVNGSAGAVTFDDQDRVVGVVAFDLADGRIQTIRSIVNPEKLRHLGPVGDLGDLLRSS